LVGTVLTKVLHSPSDQLKDRDVIPGQIGFGGVANVGFENDPE